MDPDWAENVLDFRDFNVDEVVNNDEPEAEADEQESDGEEPEDEIPEVVQRQVNNNVSVRFPGHPNPNQDEILENVLNATSQAKNTFIECPYDKERRTAVITAVLAALHTNRLARGNQASGSQTPVPRKTVAVPAITSAKIYFAVRTSRDCEEVLSILRTLRNTGYLQGLTVAVLEPKYSGEPCCETRCRTPSQQDLQLFQFIYEDGTVRSMQRLKRIARREQFCPQIFNRKLLGSANLIICPQPLLTSSFSRAKEGIELDKNAVIILDDGHDIEKLCIEEYSVAVSTQRLSQAADDLRNSVAYYRNLPYSPDFGEMSLSIEQLSRHLTDFARTFENKRPQEEQDICRLLQDSGFLNHETLHFLYTSLINYIRYTENMTTEGRHRALRPPTITNTSKFLNAVRGYFNYAAGDDKKFFLTLSKQTPVYPPQELVFFNVSCADPSIAFNELRSSSIIIGGRSLPPLTVLKEELGENRFTDSVHISQLEVTSTFFAYTDRGPTSTVSFEFSHEHKRRGPLHAEVGEAVLKFCQTVPGGIILLFSSRNAISARWESWEKNENRPSSILDDIRERKHVFNELEFDREDDARREIENFRRLCTNPIGDRTGAVMLALHRGNVFKIMNFCEGEVRLIVNVGIPYDWINSPIVKAKKKYFESKFPENVANDKFRLHYASEAFNLLNQSFAHCIGERQDWVAVIVLDERMANREVDAVANLSTLLPPWIHSRITPFNIFNSLMAKLSEFVRRFHDEREVDDDDDL